MIRAAIALAVFVGLVVPDDAFAQLMHGVTTSGNVGGGVVPPTGDGLLLTDGVSNFLQTDGSSKLCLTSTASC